MIAKIKVQYITIFLTLLVFNNHLLASDIYKREPYSDSAAYNWAHSIVIDGKIEPGDFSKFKKIFDATIKSNSVIMGVELSSFGGDVFEAMKIGDFIRNNYMTTVAPTKSSDGIKCSWGGKKDCTCNSSCFLIWAAGVRRQGNILGLHRPYFKKKHFVGLSPSDAEIKYKGMSSVVKKYLQLMDIPNDIIEKMFEYSSKEIYFLDKNKFAALRIVPFFEEWIIANCETLTQEEESDYKYLDSISKVRKLSNSENFYYKHLNKIQTNLHLCWMNKIKEIQLNIK